MSRGISLPSKEILQLLVASSSAGAEDLFYFVFRLIINQLQQRFGVISAMFGCFSIYRQERGMEDIMYLPMGRQFDAINAWADDLCDLEWSEAFGA
jgi:hypothetical protein